jgi:hypothetical protein
MSLSFTELKSALSATDGNLGGHVRKLEDAGYVSCDKTLKAAHRGLITGCSCGQLACPRQACMQIDFLLYLAYAARLQSQCAGGHMLAWVRDMALWILGALWWLWIHFWLIVALGSVVYIALTITCGRTLLRRKTQKLRDPVVDVSRIEAEQIRANEHPATLYCATCDKEIRTRTDNNAVDVVKVNNLLVGRRFECPCGDFEDLHVAAVVPKDGIRGWLRFQHALGRYLSIRHAVISEGPPPLKGGAVQKDAAVRMRDRYRVPILIVISLVFLVGGFLIGPKPGPPRWTALAVAVGVALDTLVYNTTAAFISQKPRSGLRSVFFVLIAYVELVFAFALIFVAFGEGFKPQFRPNWEGAVNATYFSIVTIATVGYGDFTPVWLTTKMLAALEIVVGLYFLAAIVANLITWGQGGSRLPTVCELLEESSKLDANRAKAGR